MEEDMETRSPRVLEVRRVQIFGDNGTEMT